MRYPKYILLLAALAVLYLPRPAGGETVTADEALQIANNWMSMIIQNTGGWGRQAAAEVAGVEEFRSDDRLLGYYCTIEPSGFIIVAAVKGLSPVKVYSSTSALDIDATDGPTALFKYQMDRIIHEVELQVGPVNEITPEDVEKILAYKHTLALDKFLKSSDEFQLETAGDASKQDYLEEEFLLSSHWHQFYPYNTQVPDASADCGEDNCAVGCVATAAAQIMRYWSWPPGREWHLMPDFIDSTSTDASIDVTAALCRDIGYDVGMSYCDGGCRSSASTADMETIYEEWRYANCEVVYRDETSQDTWWQMAKQHVSANQPIQYRIVGHSIVLDGWREWYHGYYQPEYHMNYGWNTSDDTWYEIDGLLQVDDEGTWEDEYMIVDIVPAPSLHTSVSGVVFSISGYLYVDRDCVAHAADFYPGRHVQFLPGVSLVCTELWMKFTGLPDENTYLYTPEPDRGIKIRNGAMVFYPGAGIRFQQIRPGP